MLEENMSQRAVCVPWDWCTGRLREARQPTLFIERGSRKIKSRQSRYKLSMLPMRRLWGPTTVLVHIRVRNTRVGAWP